MTPTDLKEARHTLGLSLAQMAPLLGYDGDTAKQQVRKMEAGERSTSPVDPEATARHV